MKYAVCASALLLMTSCSLFSGQEEGKTAQAELRNAQGEQVGTATLTEVPDGVQISLEISNLPPGTHAFHIHSVGKCDPPDFASAGGHFNPEGKKHGLKNPEGPHAGDMPNITVGDDGTGEMEVVNERVTLGEGRNSLFHEGGTSLVIHEKADDEVSDPSGNAGARIACGVIIPGEEEEE
jgi:Cu-Zn family superoxide dismutase